MDAGRDDDGEGTAAEQTEEQFEQSGEGSRDETSIEPTLREMTSSERTQSFHQCLIPTCLTDKLVASANNTTSHSSTNHVFRTSSSGTPNEILTATGLNFARASGLSIPTASGFVQQNGIGPSSLLLNHHHLNNNNINNHKITDNHLSTKLSRSSVAPYALVKSNSSTSTGFNSSTSTSSSLLSSQFSNPVKDDKLSASALSSVLLKLEQSGVNIGMLDHLMINNSSTLNGEHNIHVATKLIEQSLRAHQENHDSYSSLHSYQQHNGEEALIAQAFANNLASRQQNHASSNVNGDLNVNDDILMTNSDKVIVTSNSNQYNLNSNSTNQGESYNCEAVGVVTSQPNPSVTATTSTPTFSEDHNNMSMNSIVTGLGLNMVGPNITTSPGGSLDEHDCDEDKVINGDTFSPGDVPDPDAIKMFVGQVPKNLSETQLKTLFEEFGRVFQINVLRDKVTKQSKGCCFVTFYTRKAALDAQNALHNVKTLPGMNHPIQMKPADNENRYERKLFVGMLSKKCNETDVRSMFSRYGHIDECTVLRDLHGQSRGCAFITFASKQCAQSAIKALHHSITMEGCTSKLVVKFADTQKDKDQKRTHQFQTSMINNFSAPTSSLNPLANPQFFSELLVENLLQQLQQQQQSNNYFSQLNSLGVQGIPGLTSLTSPNPAATLAGLTASHSPTASNDLAALAALANFSGVSANQHSMVLGVQAALAAAMGGNHQSLSPSGANGANGLGTTNSLAGLTTGNGLHSGYNAYASALRSTVANKQAEGPEGANLFIYHLPPEWSDTDLISMFSNYGTVISAKVFIDKNTNLSKCFGFVSYDNGVSAQVAIQSMNGFQVGMKRLKVQLKRSKDAAKPY